jgi:isoleucyl-tRNA synthetase
LPIEHKALQQLKADHREMTPMEVRRLARKTAEEAIVVQKGEFEQFGLMCDWKHVYRTFDIEYEIRQLEVFRQMVKNGQLRRSQ